jgi:phosphoglucomutase
MTAPDDVHAAIGGIKAITGSGWLAVRPSGISTRTMLKASGERRQSILNEAQNIVDAALASP